VLGGALNCFVALEEISADKGQLWVAPASHLEGVWPNHQSEEYGGHREALEAPPNGVQMPALDAGRCIATAGRVVIPPVGCSIYKSTHCRLMLRYCMTFTKGSSIYVHCYAAI
jgi:hypothetical protein